MKAYHLTATGLSELRQIDLPRPDPASGQVRVRMHAASINYRDLMIAVGRYGRGRLKSPLIPLSDGAGEVTAIGPGVDSMRIGDRVVGNFFPRWLDGPPTPEKQADALGGSVDGVLAEEVVLEAAATVPMPPSLTFEEASTLPCAGLTAWVGLKEMGDLRGGQWVLALGTGGVSVFALQIAKAIGCRVIVASSSNEKLERARSLGADHLINYREVPGWDVRVRELTGGRGVDHVLEVGGKATMMRSIAALSAGGRLVQVGMLSGERGDASSAAGSGKRVEGIYVGSVSHLHAFCAFVEEHRLKPVVDRAFAFPDARAAYEALQAAGHFGKIVIRI